MHKHCALRACQQTAGGRALLMRGQHPDPGSNPKPSPNPNPTPKPNPHPNRNPDDNPNAHHAAQASWWACWPWRAR